MASKTTLSIASMHCASCSALMNKYISTFCKHLCDACTTLIKDVSSGPAEIESVDVDINAKQALTKGVSKVLKKMLIQKQGGSASSSNAETQ